MAYTVYIERAVRYAERRLYTYSFAIIVLVIALIVALARDIEDEFAIWWCVTMCFSLHSRIGSNFVFINKLVLNFACHFLTCSFVLVQYLVHARKKNFKKNCW